MVVIHATLEKKTPDPKKTHRGFSPNTHLEKPEETHQKPTRFLQQLA